MRATRWLAFRHLAFEDRSDQIVDVADRLDVTDWRQVRINSGRFDEMCAQAVCVHTLAGNRHVGVLPVNCANHAQLRER